MDSGPELIANSLELEQVRQQARTVYAKSAISAVILTAVALVT